MTTTEKRHPTTVHLLSLFDYAHLPAHLAVVSEAVAMVAHHMVDHLDDGIELHVGMRHLVYAKDALVRQAVADKRAEVERAEQDAVIEAMLAPTNKGTEQ